MRIFVVGGLWARVDAGEAPPAAESMAASMRSLGAELARAGHEILVCSPFEGAADLEIMRGVAASGESVRVEIHYPGVPAIGAAVRVVASDLALHLAKHVHPRPVSPGEGETRYAWLLSQLSALDGAHAVVAAAGNPAGSANMLLRLAEARGKPILPFGHLGGAAAASLDRQRFALADRLGDLVPWLHAPEPMARVADALNLLGRPPGRRAAPPGRPERFSSATRGSGRRRPTSSRSCCAGADGRCSATMTLSTRAATSCARLKRRFTDPTSLWRCGRRSTLAVLGATTRLPSRSSVARRGAWRSGCLCSTIPGSFRRAHARLHRSEAGRDRK